jgi:MoaA/NifB/PqqE/SkfB family radical SAM enzyme
LDGLEKVHDDIRGRPGVFSRAVETIRSLAAARERFPRLDLQTCSVFMADNQDSFDDLLDFIRDDLKPDKVAINLIRQDPRDPSLLQVSLDRYEAVTQRLREETFCGRFQNKFRHDATGFVTLTDLYMHELVARTRRSGRPQLACQAGRISAVLFHDGTLASCEILRPWGNLRDTGYRPERIWLTPVADACRRKIRAGCFCTHEIDCFLPSIPFAPGHYPALARMALAWKQAAGWKKVN